MSNNNITEKSPNQFEGPPMSLAESKTNGRRLARIGICLWPTLLIIIGVIGILIAIKILLSNAAYVKTTEFVSVKWISQSSDNYIQHSDNDIFYHLKNETSISNKKRKKRMAITALGDRKNITEDVFSKLNDKQIHEARDIIANHNDLCKEENKNNICKDLVTKLRALRNIKMEENFYPDMNMKTDNLIENRDVLVSQNSVSTEFSKRETRPANMPTLSKAAMSPETMARDPYANLYPSPSYTVNNYLPLPHPLPQTAPPLSETCLLARLLKNNQEHYKGLHNIPAEEYNHPYYVPHLRAYNRYPPLHTSTLYNREAEPQKHNVHPQDVELFMKYLTTPKSNSENKATSHQSNTTTREAQCPLGSMSCDDGDDCISDAQWCDGTVDCVDVSDEARCSCKSRVDKSRLCDGYFDCPFGEDEMGCNGCSESTFSCEDFDVNSHSTCFTKEQRCNNMVDCPNHRDEFECNSLSPSLHKKPLFAISNTEGFLHRNFRGDWYAVCKNPYMWAHDACRRETGLIIRPPFIQVVPIDPTLKVNYLNTGPGGFVHTSNTCFNSSAIYVTCPDLLCGTRMLSTPQLLRENSVIENRLFGRNKRFLLNRYRIFYGNRARRFTNKHNIEKVASNKAKYDGKRNLDNVRSKRAESRVVGGRPSQPAAWPWMAAMYRNGMFHCGGVIITQSWVVSAAHCVHGFWNHYYEIQVGMLRRFSFSPQEQNHQVSHIIVNHKYSQTDMKNDLSLLKVKTDIQFSRWVRPICLPGPDTAGEDWLWGPSPGTVCTAIGWGATVEHGPDPDHMREVELPIWSDCKHEEDREGKEICAGPVEGGKDACQGDSGGPLLCRNPINSQQWYVAGIVSHGDGCARKGEPGVYTRVSIFVKWIKHHISSRVLPTIQPKQVCPGFKCKSGILKCLPDKRVCDKTIDCLDGEDERRCSAVRSFDSIFMSRASNDSKDNNKLDNKINEHSDVAENHINLEEKIDKTIQNLETTKPTTQFLNNLEDDFQHASTIELSVSKSSEDFYRSDSTNSEEQITVDPSRSIISRESENEARGDMKFTISSSRESLESMSSVLESSPRLSTNPDRGDLKEIDIDQEESTSTQIIDTFTTEDTTSHSESTIKPTTPVTEINKTDPNSGIKSIEFTKIVTNTTSNPEEIESKSLIVELLPTSNLMHENEKEQDANNNVENPDISHITNSEKSKNLPDFEDKIKDLVLSELHPAKIRKKHLTPKDFLCRHISQIVPHEYRCDRKADCEDGTDEVDCTCTDYLSSFDKKLLCDGVFDCADGQDEIDCYSCTEDRFLCKKSQICLPTKYVCDGKPQCPQGEDELDCFALTNGKELTYEFEEKPKLSVEGFLTKKYKNDWHVVCEDNLTTEQQDQAATHICRYLGFSSANRYLVKNINIKKDQLFKSTLKDERARRDAPTVPVHFAYRTQIEDTLARHVVIKDPQLIKEECVPNVTKTCMSLYVYCDHPLFDYEVSQELYRREDSSITDRTWPWIAKIYVEGDYKCSGVLLNTSLVLIAQSCLWDLLLDIQHVLVVLGSHRTLNITRGPYEQILEVTSKTELFHSKAILLHLKENATYSSMVKPMAITSSNMPENNSMCVAVGQNEKNSTFNVFLKETEENCSIQNKCFVRVTKTRICPPGVSSHRPWSGVISCHSEQGWYPVATFVDSRGECGLGEHIVATEIVTLKKDIKFAGKKIMKHEESTGNCEGVRCGRGRCISLLKVCNGVHDCEDGNDESDQECSKKMKMCNEDPYRNGCECSSNQLRCHNGKCVSKELFNNGHDDCGDQTDEPNDLLCSRYLARVLPSGLCDGVLNCEDRSDEDPMYCKCYAEKAYQCWIGKINIKGQITLIELAPKCGKTTDVNHCVAPDVVCDGVRDCPNGEDESTCIGLTAPQGTPSGTGQVIVRSHGVWHTKCYNTQNHTRAELESICRELGFLSGHAKEMSSLAKIMPPLQNTVLLDRFSDVMLNNRTKIKLRNTQEPLARAVFDESLEHCYPVYIECL